MSYLESLCYHSIPCQKHSKVMPLRMDLSLSTLLILWLMTNKKNSNEPRRVKHIMFVNQEVVPGELTNYLCWFQTKSLLMILRKLIGQFCNTDEYLPAFLKTGKTADNFLGLCQYFSFRQQLTLPRLEIIQGKILKYRDFI